MAQKDPDSDRRSYERIPARVEVRFDEKVDAAKAFRAYSLNLSAGGLCFRTKREYQLGELLTLSLLIEGEKYSVKGIVAWIRGDAVGIRFEDVPPADRARLQDVVETLKNNLRSR